ncbi:MAG: hypothetical protein WC840_00095 [Candidatus Peribacteraceae bacterium]
MQTPVDIVAALGSLESFYAVLRAEQKIGNQDNPALASLLQATEAIHGRIAALQTQAIGKPVTPERATDAILEAQVSTATMQAIQLQSAETHEQLAALLSGAIERAPHYDRAQQLKSLQAIGELGDGFQLQGDRFLMDLTQRTDRFHQSRGVSVDRAQVAEITNRVDECHGPESANMIPGLIILTNGNIAAIDRLTREWCREGEEKADPIHNPFRILAKFMAIFSDVSQEVITHSLHFGSHSPESRTKDRSVQSAQMHAGAVLEQIITSRELTMIDELDKDVVTNRLFALLADYCSPVPGKDKRHPWFWAEKLGKSIYDPQQIHSLLTPEIPRGMLAQIITDLNNLDAVQRGLVDVPVEIGRPSPQENPAVTPEQYARTEALKRISGRMSLGEIPIPPELALRLFNFPLLQGGPTDTLEYFVRLVETLRKNHIGKSEKRTPLEHAMLFRTLATVLRREDRDVPLDLPLTATKHAGTTPRELLMQLCNTVFPPDVVRGKEPVNDRTAPEQMYPLLDAAEPIHHRFFDSAAAGFPRQYFVRAAIQQIDLLRDQWPDRFAIFNRKFAHACHHYFSVPHVDPFTWSREKMTLEEAQEAIYVPFVYPSATTAFREYLAQLQPCPARRKIVMTDQEYIKLIGLEEGDTTRQKAGVADVKTVSLWNDQAHRLRDREEFATALADAIDDETTLVIISSLTRLGDVPCGSIHELGEALKILREKRATEKHIPILIDGSQALFRQRGINQFNTFQPDAWLSNGNKLAGAGLFGFISLRYGTLTGKSDSLSLHYDVPIAVLENMCTLERILQNSVLAGCNLRCWGKSKLPQGGSPTVEDEILNSLRDMTTYAIARASNHGEHVWAVLANPKRSDQETIHQQLTSTWQRLHAQDQRGSKNIDTMLSNIEQQVQREHGTDSARHQLQTLRQMAGSGSTTLTPEQAKAFGSALFGIHIRHPSHRNPDAYGGIVTVDLPFIAGRTLANELSNYYGFMVTACGPKQHCIRISLDDRQTPEDIEGLFQAIETLQIRHALHKARNGESWRAIFDITAEDEPMV